MALPIEPRPEPVLTLSGYGVGFGERTILRSVSFEMPARGCMVLLGPSGTGKSTLLRTLAGFNDANPSLRVWGDARYRGESCAGANRPALLQQKSQMLVSTVLENLVCELPNRSELAQSAQRDIVADALSRWGQDALLDKLKTRVIECSVVEQRVIGIVRLSMAQPALLMVDEPTSGLAPADAGRVLDLLAGLAVERATLVGLHHLEQARRLADQVLLLANGRVEEHATKRAFFYAPASEAARSFLRTGSCPEEAHTTAGQGASGDHREQAIVVAPQRAAASAAQGPRGFLWLLQGQLAGTPLPGIFHDVRYDLDALRSVGITRLLSLTEAPFDEALATAFGIRGHWSPIPDMDAPTQEQARELCLWIDACLHGGEAVAVHCRAGLGRTGTMLGAYWIWRGAGCVSAPQALEHIRRIEPALVQSQVQVGFLEAFAQRLANTSTGPDRIGAAGRRGSAPEEIPLSPHHQRQVAT